MQVDFNMPGRLGAEYVGEDNARHTPVMLHRAIVGRMERFIGILIEHHAGALPALAGAGAGGRPEHHRAAGRLRRRSGRSAAETEGLGSTSDLRNEKITYKIREHSLQKLPYLLVVGDKEMQAEAVAVRARGGEDLGAMPLDDFQLATPARAEVARREAQCRATA